MNNIDGLSALSLEAQARGLSYGQLRATLQPGDREKIIRKWAGAKIKSPARLGGYTIDQVGKTGTANFRKNG